MGFNAQIPQKCAGTRTDPPPSLPTPPAEHPEAIAAASPPLDPPLDLSKFHGLLVFPLNKLFVSYAIKYSGVFVFPKTIAPARRNRATNGASMSGTYAFRISDPAGVGHPAASIQLLIVKGTP